MTAWALRISSDSTDDNICLRHWRTRGGPRPPAGASAPSTVVNYKHVSEMASDARTVSRKPLCCGVIIHFGKP